MRVKHTNHTLKSFPVYSSAFLSENQLVLGGGGGAANGGIKNKLRVLVVSNDDLGVDLDNEVQYELTKGEDAPMSMAAWSKDGTFACGINSVSEKLQKGLNENCRVFELKDGKLSVLRTRGTLVIQGSEADLEDYQKVTIISPDGSLLAVAGSHSLQLLSYPSLSPVGAPITTEKEIYDASFSNSSDQLVLATTANLQVYTIPNKAGSSIKGNKKEKGKKKADQKTSLNLARTVEIPASLVGGSFRSIKHHPISPDTLYTIINTTLPRSRSSRSKTPARQAYICKWKWDMKTENWIVERQRKVGEKGVTTFSISPDGKFLAYGSSDLSVGIVDAETLASVSTILNAHDFPPTTIAFNTSSTLLVSGSADNSIRIVRLPDYVRSSSGWFILLLTILIVLIAFVVQQFVLQ
ncbi:membrane glycoprotein spo14 [Moniliophthora roreri MCA 2997]|uniref:Membrane glycoprotein spo14 n=2 Tax=Moniliophthora roreri TaxID=221103 RepID=V2XYF2_MONRO|nr:membrane glycoprotein spo14 [Moniliophthora roreri MCA 2997]KAI3612393.1 membrane glycoprotein spo14 [Moniliophthora roreri]